jgi:hypothetical protein
LFRSFIKSWMARCNGSSSNSSGIKDSKNKNFGGDTICFTYQRCRLTPGKPRTLFAYLKDTF